MSAKPEATKKNDLATVALFLDLPVAYALQASIVARTALPISWYGTE